MPDNETPNNTTEEPLVGFDLKNFEAAVDEIGILKPTKWMFTTQLPNGLSQGQPDTTFLTNAARQVQFWASAAPIPGVTMVAHDVMRYGYGPAIKYPYSPGFTPAQIRFTADGLGTQWTFFKQWLNLVINYDMSAGILGSSRSQNGSPQQVYEVGYPIDYTTDCMISGFLDTGVEVLRIVLREAFPISLSDMRMDWTDTGGSATFTVLFQYVDWFQENLNAQTALGESIQSKRVGV